jgi:hypothetical protein
LTVDFPNIVLVMHIIIVPEKESPCSTKSARNVNGTMRSIPKDTVRGDNNDNAIIRAAARRIGAGR